MPKSIKTKALCMALFLFASSAFAGSLSGLSNSDATSGLKAALEKGSVAAVGKLGVHDGFLKNYKVKIGLPSLIEKSRPIFKLTHRGQQLDDLEVSMNRAAEAAVPMAKPLLLDAVKSMSVSDAKKILTGGDTSVTNFFREKTSGQLAVKFLPIVKKVTDRSDLSAQYNSVMSKASMFGLNHKQATVEEYVTKKTLDGLFVIIAEEEKAIRRNPIGAGSKIISKVFGALR